MSMPVVEPPPTSQLAIIVNAINCISTSPMPPSWFSSRRTRLNAAVVASSTAGALSGQATVSMDRKLLAAHVCFLLRLG